MFVAAALKELRQSVLPTVVAVVRHYTMVAIAQQAGPFRIVHNYQVTNSLDPLILVDALASIMAHEEKVCSTENSFLNFCCWPIISFTITNRTSHISLP